MDNTYIIPELLYKGVRTLSKPEGMSFERYISLQKDIAREISRLEKSKLIQMAEHGFQPKQDSLPLARSAL